MKKILLAITIFSCFAFAKCNKEKNVTPPDNPYGLPNATQTGANIFACRVNGENWIVKKSIYTLGGGIRKDTLWVSGSSGGENYFHRLTIHISESVVPGYIYNLNSSNSIMLGANWTSCQGSMGSNVIHSYAVTGQIEITEFDETRKIISGKFNCKIPVSNCDTLNIIEGRFDVRYY